MYVTVGHHFPGILSDGTIHILVGPVLNSCCAMGIFNSRKHIPVNRSYKSWRGIHYTTFNSDKNRSTIRAAPFQYRFFERFLEVVEAVYSHLISSLEVRFTLGK